MSGKTRPQGKKGSTEQIQECKSQVSLSVEIQQNKRFRVSQMFKATSSSKALASSSDADAGRTTLFGDQCFQAVLVLAFPKRVPGTTPSSSATPSAVTATVRVEAKHVQDVTSLCRKDSLTRQLGPEV